MNNINVNGINPASTIRFTGIDNNSNKTKKHDNTPAEQDTFVHTDNNTSSKSITATITECFKKLMHTLNKEKPASEEEMYADNDSSPTGGECYDNEGRIAMSEEEFLSRPHYDKEEDECYWDNDSPASPAEEEMYADNDSSPTGGECYDNEGRIAMSEEEFLSRPHYDKEEDECYWDNDSPATTGGECYDGPATLE